MVPKPVSTMFSVKGFTPLESDVTLTGAHSWGYMGTEVAQSYSDCRSHQLDTLGSNRSFKSCGSSVADTFRHENLGIGCPTIARTPQELLPTY